MKSEVRNVMTIDLKWMLLTTTFTIACLFHNQLFAQSAIELFNRAGESYKAKQFRESADDYEKLLSQNFKNAEVYYNLGNCYYRMDSIGKSILNYERALKQSPKDEDIIYNLKLAKLKSVDAIQPVPQLALITWWNNFISYNSSKGWSMLALVTIWLCLLVIVFYLFVWRRKILNLFAMLLIVVSFSALSLAIIQHEHEVRADLAVVIVRNTFVKSAPDAGAGDLFLIHEGAAILILDRVGDWNKIRLEDGKVGWMRKEGFEII
ncbi:MAG: tetratricopeptide repeat protein [Chitinophagaceae bacterium]|nr:tetratricopeptide repeat protein [Chitinophagaceae bacterium]